MGAVLSVEELAQPILDWSANWETEPARRIWFRDWLNDYISQLTELNTYEHASEPIRWQLGDLVNKIKHDLGEQAHTIIEHIHDYLAQTIDLRISLDEVYRYAMVARIFPARYRYRKLPYSAYRILAEIKVGEVDIAEQHRRRREILEAFYQARQQADIPVTYQTIAQFVQEWLNLSYPQELPDLELRPVQVTERVEPVPSAVSVPPPALPEPCEREPVVEAEWVDENAYSVFARLQLNAHGVTLQLEMSVAPSRLGLLELVKRWREELHAAGYPEVVLTIVRSDT